MEPAPLHLDLADAPDGGAAYWTTTSDGTRIRVAIWKGSARGTVLLLPGRTEYIEKYGRVAAQLVSRGLNVVCVDWRGQGLSDRPLPERNKGHVSHFDAYQQDLDAVLTSATVAELAGPRIMLAHSMGGCIGLRALLKGVDVDAAIFSAPMWGIRIHPVVRPIAQLMFTFGPRFGFGDRFAPGSGPETYVSQEPFDRNTLTTDRDHYAWMTHQAASAPDLVLGGPTLKWLHEAHIEMAALRGAPVPDTPVLTFLGTDEEVVSPKAIHRQMNLMPNGRLVTIDGARHELLMETSDTQAQVWSEIDTLLARICDTSDTVDAPVPSLVHVGGSNV